MNNHPIMMYFIIYYYYYYKFVPFWLINYVFTIIFVD